MLTYRSGIGYDVHRFSPGRPLFLGGIEIPYPLGLDGHSDADVILHAICDAVLGAAGQGDIGEHFPPGDPQFKNISSSKLLERVKLLTQHAGYEVVNVDVAVLAQEPHLKNYKEKMRVHIASILHVEPTAVNIKATTNEEMGFVGRKEGIAVYATAMLVKETGDQKK